MSESTLSTHAQAAKQIRAHIKKLGLKASVKASSASMCSSVDVYLKNPKPSDLKEVRAYAQQFQQGHFDGMNDIYEMSNRNKNLPQVKFVTVSPRFDDEIKQKALNAITNHLDIEPIVYGEHGRANIGIHDSTDCLDVMIHRTLCGVFFVPFWENSAAA
jgi:preprotein translocase subunit SecF